MSEPKPLTKDERASVERFIESGHPWADLMEAVLADSQWWRKAVKTAEFYAPCPFCDGRRAYIRPIEHKPDCPWVLAQE